MLAVITDAARQSFFWIAALGGAWAFLFTLRSRDEPGATMSGLSAAVGSGVAAGYGVVAIFTLFGAYIGLIALLLAWVSIVRLVPRTTAPTILVLVAFVGAAALYGASFGAAAF